MKKLTILTVIVFATVMSAFAQDKESEKPSKFGIRAGYHSAFMVIDGAGLAGTEPLNTFYLGVFKEYKLIPMLYAGGGLEYFQNGFQSTIIDLKRKLHYVSVPLYLKVKLGPVYATGGTALNFKVAEKNILAGASVDPLSEKSDVFDLPLQAGIGVKILMFSIEARYNWGMLDVNNGVKNQYFQLGLAVFF